MTYSAALISRVRTLCHEATDHGESSPLVVAALDMAREYEIAVKQALALEAVVHDGTKLDELIERAR